MGTVAGVQLGSVEQPAGKGFCVTSKTLLNHMKYLLKTRGHSQILGSP